MPTRVNINGRIVDSNEATIPVFDHGFLYGDSVYESFRTYSGAPILVDRNFARLESAAATIGLTLPWDRTRLANEIMATLAAARGGPDDPLEWMVRIVVTRGVGEPTPDPASCGTPSVLIMALPLKPPTPEMYRDGVMITFSNLRRDAHVASIKTGNLIHQVLGSQEARRKNAYETIFLTAEGHVSDGTRSNVYFVRDGVVWTPSGSAGIVSGITRSLVLEVAASQGIAIREERFGPSDIEGATEAFLTSTTKGILPVTSIDNRPIGDGKVGPVTTRLADGFRDAVERLSAGNATA
jgi:branched-chain amino acid aminotransferase